ncbi:MAG TPA: hypothetical protein VJQ79_14115 [Acidimicrobiia bacterium]|nr:hypothetical protein [Acidimicrobiia bacterium]
MSAEHKAALVQGRKEAKAIKTYLDALASRRPGRPITRDSLEKRLASVQARLANERDTLKQVELHQSRLEIVEALANAGEAIDMSKMEAEFAQVASAYSDRKGISYGAWRSVGVPAAVLKKAGVTRAR